MEKGVKSVCPQPQENTTSNYTHWSCKGRVIQPLWEEMYMDCWSILQHRVHPEGHMRQSAGLWLCIQWASGLPPQYQTPPLHPPSSFLHRDNMSLCADLYFSSRFCFLFLPCSPLAKAHKYSLSSKRQYKTELLWCSHDKSNQKTLQTNRKTSLPLSGCKPTEAVQNPKGLNPKP